MDDKDKTTCKLKSNCMVFIAFLVLAIVNWQGANMYKDASDTIVATKCEFLEVKKRGGCARRSRKMTMIAFVNETRSSHPTCDNSTWVSRNDSETVRKYGLPNSHKCWPKNSNPWIGDVWDCWLDCENGTWYPDNPTKSYRTKRTFASVFTVLTVVYAFFMCYLILQAPAGPLKHGNLRVVSSQDPNVQRVQQFRLHGHIVHGRPGRYDEFGRKIGYYDANGQRIKQRPPAAAAHDGGVVKVTPEARERTDYQRVRDQEVRHKFPKWIPTELREIEGSRRPEKAAARNEGPWEKPVTSSRQPTELQMQRDRQVQLPKWIPSGPAVNTRSGDDDKDMIVRVDSFDEPTTPAERETVPESPPPAYDSIV